MEALVLPEKKENILLSVSRFDLGGNKQQIEIIKAYENLVKKYPKRMKDWKLVLVGGSFAENPYLEKIKKILSEKVELNIVLKVNVSAEELKLIFQKAKIFWHFVGLNQSDPARFEHFGMTVAESMQSGCVPIVFNGGGQREIIENNISGFLFSSQKELFDKTLELIKNPGLLNQISQNAFQRGKKFRKEIFITEIKTYFNNLLIKNLGTC
jgi:glycosyltransferase involved in cell wall biosynthesis